MAKRKGLDEINKILTSEAGKKPTVKSLEDQAQRMYDYHKQHYADKSRAEFYRGVLRAFELLREHGLLKEDSVVTWDNIFAEAERIFGRNIRHDVEKHWKRMGKAWVIKQLHIQAKNRGKTTSLPLYCPRKRGKS